VVRNFLEIRSHMGVIDELLLAKGTRFRRIE
jgi:hypothetical protein